MYRITIRAKGGWNMRRNRVLAVVMAVLMLVTLLPSMVFAAEAPAGTLDGTLKIKGSAKVGSTLSADFSKVKPSGVTSEYVSFSWSLKDGDILTEVGTGKTYKVDEKAEGLPIVLKVTGKEDKGITGSLTATSGKVSAAKEGKDSDSKGKDEKKETKSEETSDSAESKAAETNGADSTEQNVEEQDSADQNSAEQSSDDESSDAQKSEDQSSSDSEKIAEPAQTEKDTDSKDSENTETSAEEKESVTEIPEETEELTYSAAVSTEDGSGVLDFGSVEEGYTETPEAQTVSITNNGTGELNFKSLSPEHFMVQDINEEPLKAGETVTVFVQPREGIAAGEYKDTITYETEEGVQVSFEADFTVTAKKEETSDAEVTPETTPDADEEPEPAPEEATYKLSADNTELSFDTLKEGYENIEETRTITIRNEGTAAATLIQPESDYFDIAPATAIETDGDIQIEAGGEQMFTVQPKLGLSAQDAPYTEELVFAAEEDETATVTVKVQVSVEKNAEPVYGLSISPESLEFGSSEEGYKEAPEEQKVTVTNTGNTSITLKQPESKYYTVGTLSETELTAGSSATFTVQPKSELAKGEYLEDISISNSEDVECYVNAHFSVTKKADNNNKKENNLTGIKKPSDITDLPNGTEKSQKALKLPATVTVTTTKGEQKAEVKWDVKGCAYSPESADRQTFNVKGTVTLPDGVKNPDNISTVIAVSVTVNAYSGNQAEESENKITGIDASGKYDTNSKITFTAVGAGMDNESPKKGDTRYLPGSWKITETRTWDAAPYTATFRVSKAGQYTLTVTFKQQKYNGSKWENTGSESYRKVTFKVSQAAVVTTAATVTPKPTVTGTNKKSAVQTGDSTPIVPFVIALVAACAIVGGVVVYKRKKK